MENESLLHLGSLQHDQLMAKREDLGLHCGLSSKTGKQGTEHHYYKDGHGRRRLTTETCNFNNFK